MTDIEKRLAAARRRLYLVRFLETLPRVLAWLIPVPLALLVAERLGVLPLSLWTGAGIQGLLLGAFLGAGVVWAAGAALFRRISCRETALRVDGALGLRERLVSSLDVLSSQHPLRDLMLADTRGRLEGVALEDAFPAPSPRCYRPAALMLMAYALLFAVLGQHDAFGWIRDDNVQQAEAARDRQAVTHIARDLRRDREELLRLAEHFRGDTRLQELLAALSGAETRLTDDGIDSAEARLIRQQLDERIHVEQVRLARDVRMSTGPRADSGQSGSQMDPRRRMVNRMTDAAGAIRSIERRMQPKGTGEAASPEDLRSLADDMRQFGEALTNDPELRALAPEMGRLADELKDLAGTDPEVMRRMQELMRDVLKGVSEGQGPDLSKLTPEERELLVKLQELLRNMELTEDMIKRLKDQMERGNPVMLDEAALKAMLEALKRAQDNPEGDSGCSGGSPGAGIALVPVGAMPAAGGGGNASGGSGPPGSRHAGMRAPPAEREATFEDTHLRASRIGAGATIAEVFVVGPSGKSEVATEYRAAQYAAAREAVEAMDAQVIPAGRKDVIRDYMNRINGLADRADEAPAP